MKYQLMVHVHPLIQSCQVHATGRSFHGAVVQGANML